jgi:hypothetical protein
MKTKSYLSSFLLLLFLLLLFSLLVLEFTFQCTVNKETIKFSNKKKSKFNSGGEYEINLAMRNKICSGYFLLFVSPSPAPVTGGSEGGCSIGRKRSRRKNLDESRERK